MGATSARSKPSQQGRDLLLFLQKSFYRSQNYLRRENEL
jgi:hypothetical protein